MAQDTESRIGTGEGVVAMERVARWMFVLTALGATVVGPMAIPSSARAVTSDQLLEAGWSCRQPAGDPTRRVCGHPGGEGLPPLPGSAAFADRAPSYELLTFEVATGEFIGIQKLLRPDIYLRGMPPCPQQPGGEYFHVPGIDLWACFLPV